MEERGPGEGRRGDQWGIGEGLELVPPLPVVARIEPGVMISGMARKLREAWSDAPQEGDQIVRTDMAQIRFPMLPLPVEVSDVGDPGEAPQRDATIPAELDEERRKLGPPLDMVMRIDLRRALPAHLGEQIERPFGLP